MRNNKMKAYLVSAPNFYECGGLVVFAESPSKAKAIALGWDGFEDVPYVELSAKRDTVMDKYCSDNENYLDWFEQDDRSVLVKEKGWYCQEYDKAECSKCKAKEDCSLFQDLKREYNFF